MTEEQIFGAIAWVLLGYIVYLKQYTVTYAKLNVSHSDSQATAFLLGLVAPLTVIIYAFRVVFFEDWE